MCSATAAVPWGSTAVAGPARATLTRGALTRQTLTRQTLTTKTVVRQARCRNVCSTRFLAPRRCAPLVSRCVPISAVGSACCSRRKCSGSLSSPMPPVSRTQVPQLSSTTRRVLSRARDEPVPFRRTVGRPVEPVVASSAGGAGRGLRDLPCVAWQPSRSADLSRVGVTRPMTSAPHACVWRMDGAGPLLDWLGVPRRYRYGRASALDGGEESLAGLVLLDLPDHDSVVAGSTAQVDRLVALADLMIWVLDPQKYADAAVHRRYFTPLAGHSAVTTVVLNQADRLTDQ